MVHRFKSCYLHIFTHPRIQPQMVFFSLPAPTRIPRNFRCGSWIGEGKEARCSIHRKVLQKLSRIDGNSFRSTAGFVRRRRCSGETRLFFYSDCLHQLFNFRFVVLPSRSCRLSAKTQKRIRRKSVTFLHSYSTQLNRQKFNKSICHFKHYLRYFHIFSNCSNN